MVLHQIIQMLNDIDSRLLELCKAKTLEISIVPINTNASTAYHGLVMIELGSRFNSLSDYDEIPDDHLQR